MAHPFSEHNVLPRPAEQLPDYAMVRARQGLAEALEEAFQLSPAAAKAISNAVVDPSPVRRAVSQADARVIERLAVPGGMLLGVRTPVWAHRVMPDPRNPRTLPSWQHPFAVDPGTGAEASKFRPLPEPRTPSGMRAEIAELGMQVESREHLNWACQQAATYVLANNNWKDSIASQGVMEAVYLTATTYYHDDNTDPVTVPTTSEGSSRVTCVHDILGIRSSDVPYTSDQDVRFRAWIRKMNESYERGADKAVLDQLRCARIPALIFVGFEPYHADTTGFPTAVKSIVALRHVDPPTPWGEGPENESLANEVLDELHRRNLISDIQKAYYAGACTKSEARVAHLSDDPVIRATEIVGLFTNPDERFRNAIRIAVTSQSTRKRVGMKLLNDLATALALRALAGATATRADQVRRYLRFAFSKSVHTQPWEATRRGTDILVQEALAEVSQCISNGSADDGGPASLELMVRAAYPLVVSGRLNADRGSANNDQPDRRTPGELLDAMRQTHQGIHQLGQALCDFAVNQPIRAVGNDGAIKFQGDAEQHVNDVYLRCEFPAAGKARARRPGETPMDRYHNGISALASAMSEMNRAFEDLRKVVGNDGQPLVETRGVDHRDCTAWRDMLAWIDDELVLWAVTHRRANGVNADLRRFSDNVGSNLDTSTEAADEWDQIVDDDQVEAAK
jgi:hypothetical protein